MECRFHFSPAELGRSVPTYRRLGLRKTLLICGAMWLIFIALVVQNMVEDTNPGHLPFSIWLVVQLWILIVPLLITLFYFTPVWAWYAGRSFRKNPLCNQDVLYQLGDTGFTLQSPVLSQSVAWPTVGTAGESAQGFMMFLGKQKRSFHWLPKHGFASEADVAACSELIRSKVPNFRRVG